MALTEQQKAENKAAQRVRDKAHQSRYKQLNAVLDAVDMVPAVLTARQALRVAETQFDAAIENRTEAERVMRAQIAKLEEDIKALRDDPAFDAIKAKRTAAGDIWRHAKSAAVKDAENQFPDMLGDARFSAVCWEPPQDVLVEMELARLAAFKPAAKKKANA
jgi:hypothetical protein